MGCRTDVRGTSVLQRPERSEDRKTSGGCLLCADRSGDLGPMGTRAASASKIKKG